MLLNNSQGYFSFELEYKSTNKCRIKLFDIRNEKVIYSIDNSVLNELCKSNICFNVKIQPRLIFDTIFYTCIIDLYPNFFIIAGTTSALYVSLRFI